MNLVTGLQDFTGVYFACRLQWPDERVRSAISALYLYTDALGSKIGTHDKIVQILIKYCSRMLDKEIHYFKP